MLDIEQIKIRLKHVAMDQEELNWFYIFYKEDVPLLLAKLEELEKSKQS